MEKVISRTNINTPKGNSALKDLGFTKLVKRDDGVYENVTARSGDSRYMVAASRRRCRISKNDQQIRSVYRASLSLLSLLS